MSLNPKVPYISCIKLNGVPILPPVISPELRKDLLRFKRQAVKLENRLKNCRDLKKNLDELLDIHTERPCSQLTFSDNSHIEALNIVNKPGDHEFRTSNLSRDIIEVTQYNDSGMTTICSNVTSCKDDTGEKTYCDSDKADQSKISDPESAKICNTISNEKVVTSSNERPSQCYDNEFHKPITSPTPRLIRSNSYTLESPSPILLAHWKKTSCLESLNTDSTGLTSARNWTSLENNYVPFESSDFSSADTVYHKESNSKNSNRSEAASTPDKSAKTINELKSPTIEVYQTDISVQQITVNTNAENGLTSKEKSEKFLSKNPFEVFEPDCELLNVLKDIPETYANQIIELLRVQHLEQKDRLERYDNLGGSPEKHDASVEDVRCQSGNEVIRKEAMSESFSKNPTVSTPSSKTTCEKSNHISRANEKSNEYIEENGDSDERPHTTETFPNCDKTQCDKLRRSSTFSMSPSQSLYYSICSDVESLTVPSSPCIQLIDLESNNGDDLEIGVLREKNGYWEGVMIHENAKNIDCSKELFPEIDPVTMDVIKKEWAASVIGANVKGYLTRRLLKTEKVQGLIATIKDVLMCAVELHHSDNIDEKDVELHRRLINQLSAALYSFHDTFFDLSIPEQMLIIAADRQRKLEKLKRPQSAKTLSRPVSGKSSSSSIKSNRSLPSSRSSSKHKLFSGSPSLTKV